MNPSQNPSALRSKNEITDALLRLMQIIPYHEITVKQILLEAQVARKTFYRNFLSKDDVLNAYLDTIMYEYIQLLLQMRGCQLSNILDIIFQFCQDNKDFFFLLRNNNLMYLFLEKWNTFIPIIHNQIVSTDHPMFKPFCEKQVEYIIAFNVGAIWNILMKWIEYDMADSTDSMKETLLGYLNNMTRFL